MKDDVFRLGPPHNLESPLAHIIQTVFRSVLLLMSLRLSTSSSLINQKWVLKKRPNGLFQANTDAGLITEKIELGPPAASNGSDDDNSDERVVACPDDSVVVKVSTLSVDAFIRTMLDVEAFHGSVACGGTLPAVGYGTVIHAGKKSKRKVGSKVIGMMGAQSYAVLPAAAVQSKWDLPFLRATAALGLMGLTTGITAYVGCFYVLQPPKRRQTAVVTAATGAVGNVAVQLLRTTGARVVGIVGGPTKTTFLRDSLKCDGVVDYKDSARSLEDQLKEACPNGIDFVFDNVGGETLNTLLGMMNTGARVVICGAVSQYSGNLNKGKVQGPGNYLKLAEKGATMKGFVVTQYMKRIPFVLMNLFWYHLRGKVQVVEHIENGIESFASALEKMFSGGQHIGKLLVKVTADE